MYAEIVNNICHGFPLFNYIHCVLVDNRY